MKRQKTAYTVLDSRPALPSSRTTAAALHRTDAETLVAQRYAQPRGDLLQVFGEI